MNVSDIDTEFYMDWLSCEIYSLLLFYILSRIWVTTTRVWIGEQTHWPLTGRNHKQLPHYKSLDTKFSQFISTSLYVVTALHNGCSSAMSSLHISW
jgi:hypothetical protein